MTREQKKQTREALREYEKLQRCAASDEKAARWCAAIAAALDYYDREEPTRAALLRLRYMGRHSEAETIERLYVGRTSYLRMEIDALSTVAVEAASRGCFGA